MPLPIRYAGEVFAGYNKPKRTPGENKKFAVLVKDDGGEDCLVRFGDPSMEHYKEGDRDRGHGDEQRREDFRRRHNCDEKSDPTTPGYWSCRHSW